MTDYCINCKREKPKANTMLSNGTMVLIEGYYCPNAMPGTNGNCVWTDEEILKTVNSAEFLSKWLRRSMDNTNTENEELPNYELDLKLKINDLCHLYYGAGCEWSMKYLNASPEAGRDWKLSRKKAERAKEEFYQWLTLN